MIGHKRSGDNELVEMQAAEHYAVPVSRSRVGSLKSRVAAITGGELGAQRRRQHVAVAITIVPWQARRAATPSRARLRQQT